MVLGFSKEEREERRSKRSLDKAAQRIANQKRDEARRRGLIDAAAKEGYKEGREKVKGGGSGVIGFLKKAAGANPKTVRTTRYVGKGKHRHRVTTVREQKGSGLLGHFEIGPNQNTERGFDLGFGTQMRGADLGLGGFGELSGSGKKKGKKSDPYADLGL